jgi:hypothetical protein
MSDLDGLLAAARAEVPDAARKARALAALRAAAGGPGGPGSGAADPPNPSRAPEDPPTTSVASSSSAPPPALAASAVDLATTMGPSVGGGAPSVAGGGLGAKLAVALVVAGVVGWVLASRAPAVAPSAAPPVEALPVTARAAPAVEPTRARSEPTLPSPGPVTHGPSPASPRPSATRPAATARPRPMRGGAPGAPTLGDEPITEDAPIPVASSVDDPLAREVAALEAARRAHAQGDDAAAELTVETYLTANPRGQLRPEAWALAITLAQARGDEATAAARRAARDEEAR